MAPRSKSDGDNGSRSQLLNDAKFYTLPARYRRAVTGPIIASPPKSSYNPPDGMPHQPMVVPLDINYKDSIRGILSDRRPKKVDVESEGGSECGEDSKGCPVNVDSVETAATVSDGAKVMFKIPTSRKLNALNNLFAAAVPPMTERRSKILKKKSERRRILEKEHSRAREVLSESLEKTGGEEGGVDEIEEAVQRLEECEVKLLNETVNGVCVSFARLGHGWQEE